MPADVDKLVRAMEASIGEARTFIADMTAKLILSTPGARKAFCRPLRLHIRTAIATFPPSN